MHSRLGVEIERFKSETIARTESSTIDAVCFWFWKMKNPYSRQNGTVEARELSVQVFALKGRTVVELMNERIQSNK